MCRACAHPRCSQGPEPRSGARVSKRLWWPEICAPLPSVPWLNEGLNLAPGRAAVLASVGGGYKGWMAATMAFDAARDVPWLGRFPWRKGGLRVLYVDYEQGERETRRRFQALAQGAGGSPHLGRRLGYEYQPVDNWSKKRDPRVLDRIKDLVLDEERELVIDLVIVDSLIACNPGVDENSAAAAEPLALAAQASEDTGAGFLFLDHVSPKGKGEAKSPLELLASQRGHSSKLGASSLLLVAQHGPVDGTSLVTCIRSQNAPRKAWPAPFVFELEQRYGGEVGICSDAPDALAKPPTVAKPGALETLYEAIVVTVRECPHISKNEIAKAVGGRKATVIAAVQSLVSAGRLKPVPGGFVVPGIPGTSE